MSNNANSNTNSTAKPPIIFNPNPNSIFNPSPILGAPMPLGMIVPPTPFVPIVNTIAPNPILGTPVSPFIPPVGLLPTFPPTIAKPIIAPPILPKPTTTPTTISKPLNPLIDKKTTVYVGNISSKLEGDLLIKLLEKCGAMEGFKRMKDPTNNTWKNFGFCDYLSAEGAMRCIRLLNNREIEGSKLVVKADKKTEQFLLDYKQQKKASSDGDDFEKEAEQADQKAADDINALFKQYEKTKEELEKKKRQSEEIAIKNTIDKIVKEGVIDSIEEKKMLLKEQIINFRENEKEKEKEKEEREKEREKLREREKNRLWEREQELVRDRKRARQMEEDRERRQKERDLRNLERSEREREKRMKSGYEDDYYNEYYDNIGTHGFSRYDKRRRYSDQQHISGSDMSDDSEDEEYGRIRRLIRKEKEKYYLREIDQLSGDEDMVEADDKLSLAKRLGAASALSKTTVSIVVPKAKESQSKPSLSTTAPSTTQDASAKKVFAAYDDEEELDAKKKTKLASMEQIEKLSNDPATILARLPKTSEELFNYPINWDLVDQQNIIKALKSFVSNKIKEMLGIEEPTLEEFVLGKLHLHEGAQSLIEDLTDTLGKEETESFVDSLWRQFLVQIIQCENRML